MSDRTAWLAQRKRHLGASEVAAVLGVDPWRGPLAIYERKVGDTPSQADEDHLAFGREVEGAIAGLYRRRTGRPIEDLGATTIQVHPDVPWLGATLDRVTEGTDDAPAPAAGRGALELKHVGGFGVRSDDWREEPPLHYQIQVQAQIACAGFEWGSLAGMFPGYQLAYRDVTRDDEFLEAALPILERFWDRVERRDPPPVEEGEPGALEVVKRLWHAETGETIALPEDLVGVADEWERAKAEAREAEKRAKGLEAQLRGAIQDNTFGALLDGTLLSLKITKRKGYTRVVEPTEYRTLRRVRPKGK